MNHFSVSALPWCTEFAAEYGPDINTNPRLAGLVVHAKKAGFPKSSIESAIARGQGVSPSGAMLETMTIEAMIPPSIAAVIECQTDSKARARPSSRSQGLRRQHDSYKLHV